MKVENLTRIIELNAGFRKVLFENISLDIEDGAITGIVAPAASGKSSLLELLAGISISDNSKSKIDDAVLIPSLSSSFPWLDVTANIKFGNLALTGDQLKTLVTLVGLEGYENHFPNNKSLGFRFRISLARSLAAKPSIILIDEPFHQMDDETRQEMYQLILNINKNLGTTILIATNNISEGILLSGKIYMMKKDPLEIVSSLNCDYDSEDINARKKSPVYSKCLHAIEDILLTKELHQSYSISI